MWFVILFIIVSVTAVICAAALKHTNKKEEELKEIRKNKAQRQTVAHIKTYQQNYKLLTKAEKQQFPQISDTGLSQATINTHNIAINVYQTYLSNSDKAVYWMQKAEISGNLDAKYFMGRYLILGYGFPADKYHKALGTAKIIDAAKAGNELAIDCLRQEFNMSEAELKTQGIPV